MAIVVFEGFDHYNTITDFLARTGALQWQLIANTPPTSYSFDTGLTGYGKAFNWTSHQNIGEASHVIRGVWNVRNQEGYYGLRINIPAGWSFKFSLGDGVAGSTQAYLVFNAANYSIQAYRGDDVLLGSSANNVWQSSTENFIELHWKIANSGGIMNVRNNNISVLNVTGVDTQISVNAWSDLIDMLPFGSGIGISPSITIDDLYYCDTSSGPGVTPANTFLGDSTTRTLFAVGNSSVMWIPFANTNWQEISEIAMDSDASYNSTSTPTDQDLFNFGSMENTLQTVYAIQLTGAYRKDDAGVRTVKQAVKSGATTSYGSNWNVPDNVYSYFTDLFVLNPTTSLNFTLAEVNALAVGYNLVA